MYSIKTLFCFALLFLFSCNGRQPSTLKEVHVSKTQKGIQSLVDSFKLDYSRAETKALQDTTVNKYNLELFNFLSSNYIDSIHVHVDTVIIQDLKITTKFHCNKDIAFQYGMIFKNEMNKTWDSVYHFMKRLKIGSDTTISFAYMGSHQLSNPFDTTQPVLKIFAFPTPKFSERQ